MPIVSDSTKATKAPAPFSHPQGPCYDPETIVLTWESPTDPGNPKNWPSWKKWGVVGLGLLATFISLMNGTIITVAHEAIDKEFSIDESGFPHSYWPVSSWGVGGAMFSLGLLPVMEDFGIRYVFLLVYCAYLCFLVPTPVAHNFATLIVTRFFSGGCVAILANSVAGVISNVFEGNRARTVPMSLYITTYLISSSMGPVIGSSIFKYLSWRWIGYLQLIWTGALFPLFIVGMPESRESAILRSRAKKLRAVGKKTYTKEELDTTPLWKVILQSVSRPLYMLCTEPVVFVATLWSAFSLGTVYLFTQSAEQVFSGLYGWDAIEGGFIQAAIVIGEFLGWLLCVATNRWYYESASRNTEVPGVPIPEARLYPALIGGLLGVTGGMFLYAWTSYTFSPWIAPAIGLAMVGFGTTAVVVSIANYLVDAYSKYAGSAVGAIGLGENTFIAFLPLAAQSMYTNLGFQWASSLLGFFSLALAFAPVGMFVWGKEIRGRSPFMREATEDRRRDSAVSAEIRDV